MKRYELTSFDGKILQMYKWDDVQNPKGVLQLIHGMSEHMSRYDEFANFMNENGYIVIGDDHRGHGLTAETIDRIGKIESGQDIFECTLQDELLISQQIQKEYQNLKHYVLGHSYGSFIAQKFIQTNSRNIDGVILTGSACMKGAIDVFFGSKLIKNKKDDDPAELIRKMTFDKYDKKLKTGRWITRDQRISDAYYADPMCSQIFSFGFYKSFFKGLKGLYFEGGLKNIRKDLPLHIASGALDYVGKCGKLVKKLEKMYLKCGLTNVSIKLYDKARHEILNETNRNDVYQDLLNFIDKNQYNF